MQLRLFIFICCAGLSLCLLTINECCAQQGSKQEHESTRAQSTVIAAELRLRDDKVIMGREVSLDISITNCLSVSLELYNPHFKKLLMARQRAAELVVFGADGVRLGDLLHFQGGSTLAGPIKTDWVTLGAGETVRSNFRFQSGIVPGNEFTSHNPLAAGKYVIELRLHEPFVSGRPVAYTLFDDVEAILGHSSYYRWRDSFPGPEICRSNRVELEILPRTGD